MVVVVVVAIVVLLVFGFCGDGDGSGASGGGGVCYIASQNTETFLWQKLVFGLTWSI